MVEYCAIISKDLTFEENMTEPVEEVKPVPPPNEIFRKDAPSISQKVMQTMLGVLSEAVAVHDPPKSPYPETVAEVLDDEIKYRPGTDKALKKFRRSHPWRGTVDEMQLKLRVLCEDLAKVYEVTTPIIAFVDSIPVGGCCVRSKPAVLIIQQERRNGRYSVVAFLHEFSHVLGKGEKSACKWSINLFRRHFPKSYAKLVPVGHLLISKETAEKMGVKIDEQDPTNPGS